MEYCNKVLELDVKNYKAWRGKAIVSLRSSAGYEYKLKEGLQYSLKAYSYGSLKEKAEIEEEMILESISDKYNDNGIEQIDFLNELFKAFGNRDSRIIIKIIDLTDKAIYQNVAFGVSYYGESSLGPDNVFTKIFYDNLNQLTILFTPGGVSCSFGFRRC